MSYKLLFISLFAMVSCHSQKKMTDNPAAKKTDIIYLKEGENRFVDAVQMNVTFNKLLEDSRCPKGTQCAWQGVGTVEISVMSTHSRPVTFKLSTHAVPGKSYSTFFEFNGCTVSLVSLNPYPGTQSGTPAYVAGLKFVQATWRHPGQATVMPIGSGPARAAEDKN